MKRTYASFRNAARGVRFAWMDEPHLRLQVWAAYTALAVGTMERVPPGGLALLAVAAGLVLAAEVGNSALEAAVDLFTREWRADAGRVKDMAAGAVLVASATAVAVGVLVLGPGLAGLALHVRDAGRESPGGLTLAVAVWAMLGLFWLRGLGRPRQGGEPPRPGGPAGRGSRTRRRSGA